MKRVLFGLSPRQASFEVRGFTESGREERARLERVIEVFLEGYNLALDLPEAYSLCEKLQDRFDPHHVGFAFEGAGMRYGLHDLLMPGKRSRLRAFTDGPGARHDYICTAGAGFAVARVPWGLRALRRYLDKLDPLIAWCVLDGYGFHQGFFHPGRYVAQCEPPPALLPAFARQLFDAGLGRAIWWVEGASPVRVAKAVRQFPEGRRAELWCGIGVALAYAGGPSPDACFSLLREAGPYGSHLLSGVPFAARMRQKGCNTSQWTEGICISMLGTSADEAADMLTEHVAQVLRELKGAPTEVRERCYGMLRQRLLRHLESSTGDSARAVI